MKKIEKYVNETEALKIISLEKIKRYCFKQKIDLIPFILEYRSIIGNRNSKLFEALEELIKIHDMP